MDSALVCNNFSIIPSKGSFQECLVTLVQVGNAIELEIVDRQFKPYLWGALVVWPDMLFPNIRGNKDDANLCISTLKNKWLFMAQNLPNTKTFLTLKLIQYEVARCPQASLLLPAATAAYLETRYFCAHLSNPPMLCRSAAPELCHWFCIQNVLLSFGKALGSNYQMTDRGFNLDSNLNSAAWPTGCEGLTCS